MGCTATPNEDSRKKEKEKTCDKVEGKETVLERKTILTGTG
jgi:hypothetical protein